MMNDQSPFRPLAPTQAVDSAATVGLFDLTQFFDGAVSAWGLIEPRFGGQVTRFVVDMSGTWSGDTLIVVENFRFDDGRTETKTWHVSQMVDGAFSGSGSDIVGTAKGSVSGDHVHMTYKYMLRLERGDVVVDYDDHIHRIDARRALNKGTLCKLGIKLADVTIFFERTAE